MTASSRIPAATLARAVPHAEFAAARGGTTVHLLVGGMPACGRRPRRLQSVDQDGMPALPICVPCTRTLPDVTRMHLATLGRPTVAELAAVHEHAVRTIAARAAAELQWIREDAVLDGSVSERVHLAEAVEEPREDRPEALTYGGHTVAQTPMTLGLLIGVLIPGARTNGRVWINNAPPSGSLADVAGGSVSGEVAITAPAPGKYTPAGAFRPGWTR